MSRPNWIGQTVGGRYRIDEILGQGGMSAVYKAFDPNLKRTVAVKMIHAHLADDPKFLVRFEEEAAAVAQLRHPNIVQVYDFNHDEDLYYMVQEFIPGETLQERLRRLNKSDRRMEVTEAIGFTMNICEAAGYAHRRGMIHRDIKPANIMLDTHGQAILMDFGIVKITGGERHTATGAVMGTALYLPPELIRGEVPDPRSDIYSLGITLFEMVSGKPPFEADSAMSLMMMHLNEPVPDLRQLRPEVPEALIAVIHKSLEKDPKMRFASMDEMASTLALGMVQAPNQPTTGAAPTLAETAVTGAVALTPASTIPVSAPYSASESQPSSTFAEKPPPTPPPPPPSIPGQAEKGRKPVAWIIAGSILAVVIIFIGGWIFSRMNSVEGGNQSGDSALSSSSAATRLAAIVQPTDTPEPSPTQPEPTQTPTVTNTLPPSETPTPTIIPSPTIPVGIPFSHINGITVDNQQRYVVEYETFEFTEAWDGQHVHFFYNTTPQEQAGEPTDKKGKWWAYGGPRPFVGFNVSARPEFASQICILVANLDHTVQLDTGNCFTLPDVPVASPLQDIECLAGPDPAFPAVTKLSPGQDALVLGISPDEAWWNVANPQNPAESCWLLQSETKFSGDISTLPLVTPPPLPEGGNAGGFFVEIQSISLDVQNQYVVNFITRGFDQHIPGTHMHFFFNTVPPELVSGLTASGERKMFGDPSPFTGYLASDRPGEATELCVLVANPDHTVIPESGNCFKLPGIP
jgi:serine/threonine-protein kinase